jgi:lambda family phage tail tape measure protein
MAEQQIGIRLTLSGNQQVDAGLQQTGKKLDEFGKSSAQTAAAMRMLPAQMTDIVTSLASGQQPLTVLLQQGGQLKDMFGGVGPAARALGQYAVGLVNPFTAAAAAAAALGYAYYQASAEAGEFRKALVMSGNVAGASVDQLASMAQSMRDVGMTTGKAAEIMTQLAATGQVAAADFQRFTQTAAAMESAFGVPVENTVKAFAELGKAPVEASRKLNEEHHYLTAAVYEQIKALEEEGRTLEAGQLAQRSYDEAMKARSDNIVQNLGYVESAWKSAGSAAKWAWDHFLDVDRPDSLEEKLAKAREKLAEVQGMGSFRITDEVRGIRSNQVQSEIEGLQEVIRLRDRSALQQRERQTANEAAIKALDAVGKLQDKGLSKQEQLNKALTEYRANLDRIRAVNPNSEALSAAQVAAGEKALRDQFKETAKAKDTTYERLTARVQDFTAAQQAELEVGRQLSAGEKLAADVKAELERAGGKVTAQQRQSILSGLEAALAVEKQTAAQKDAAKAAEAYAQALEKTQNKADGLRRSMADSLASQREQYDDRLSVMGLGSQSAERLASRVKIEREYARFRAQLTEEAAKNKTLESDAYKNGVADIEASLQRALEANERYYGRVDELRSNSMLGLSQAVANYGDNAADLFGQTETLTNNALRGMEDSLVRFVQTGKLSFADLANSIVADLSRMIIKQTIFNAMAGMMSSSIGVGMANAMPGDSLDNFIGLNNGFGTMPGRASGGSVSSGGLYQVAEQGPELLHTAGKTYLMMGSQGGSVTPSASGATGPQVSIVVNNTAGSETRASASASTDAMGNTVIDVLVERVEAGMAQRVARGGGMAPVLERRYGLNPAMGAMR